MGEGGYYSLLPSPLRARGGPGDDRREGAESPVTPSPSHLHMFAMERDEDAAFCLKEDKIGRDDYLTGSGPENRINSKKVYVKLINIYRSIMYRGGGVKAKFFKIPPRNRR